MTLKQALSTYIQQQAPVPVPVFVTESLDGKTSDIVVIRDAAPWDTDASGYWQHPAIEVTVRTSDQAAGEALAGALYRALNTRRALQLDPDYTALRATCPAPPEPDGRDDAGRWVRRFEINFLLHATAAL